VSQSDSWSGRDDASDEADVPAVAEQMRAATRSLRARLSIVRDQVGEATEPAGSDV
jgi:hypothetical protein